ncbi:glutamate racemase [Candidatus Symbiothrix dinenymphae]|nr:glutamate racemase [Candidatus Symbiothrix dinenymphae]
MYDYLYLGDNARAPYGTRSFEVVYEFTLQAVRTLFDEGCPLVILACNTASAKALRTIQQRDLPQLNAQGDVQRRVLGVIRPTVECVGNLTRTRHAGVFATPGTILSESYPLEIAKLFPDITVTGEACPMWVPFVENGEAESDGVDYYVRLYIERLLLKDPKIDAIILGCTHYPLLEKKIKQFLPPGINLIAQGNYVADSLADYLQRHSEIERNCSQNSTATFLTTESEVDFSRMASVFLKDNIRAHRITLK